MADRDLSDAELVELLDTMTLWVAATPEPRSFWSLREALMWIWAQPQNAEFALYRPPDHQRGTQYVPPEQIARLKLRKTAGFQPQRRLEGGGPNQRYK